MSFNFLKISDGKLVLSVHPPYGTAVYSSKIITRDNPRAEITESEIENAISQAIWRLFDEERMLFAKRLDVSEMDIVMADVRVLSIKLDEGTVVNPIGFMAKTIEIELVETMITRSLLENIKLETPKKGEVVFTIEPIASCAWLIQNDSKNKKKDFAVARILDSQTFIYHSAHEGKISYISDFDWGTNQVLTSLADYFGISALSAKALLDRYVRGDMSVNMQKGLKGIVSEPFASFSRGVTLAAHNVKIKQPVLYVMSHDFQGLNSKNILWKESGVKINFLPSVNYIDLALHEMSHADLNSPWNRTARRRMKWLMCHK